MAITLPAQSGAPFSVRVNASAFTAGQTMSLTATVMAVAPARPVDAYVFVQLPTGQRVSLLVNGQMAAGLHPIARNFLPFHFEGLLARYTFTGSEPAGTYTWFAGLTEAGRTEFIAPPVQASFTFAPASSPMASCTVGGAFRMMTWNIHHGVSTSNVLSVPQQAEHIAGLGAHVVALQEVQTWDQNQPQMFESELERITGMNWSREWAPVQPRNGTEGNMVLTCLPVLSSTSHQMHATADWSALLSNRSVAHMTVTVGGVPVHVFSTHLESRNTTWRTAQLIDLVAWLRNFSGRAIVAGDFNAIPGTYWIDTMLGDFSDSWQDLTGSASGGGTFNGARLDYLFRGRAGASGIQPVAIRVVPSLLSDHWAVVADYAVRP